MEQKYNVQEISIKEIIRSIITYWKLVVGIPLVLSILAFVYLWFIASPVYEARLEGIINVPEAVETQYGLYTFPKNTAKDILSYVVSDRVMEEWLRASGGDDAIADASVENAVKRVVVNSEEGSNQFSIKLKADSPKVAKEQLELLSKIFIEEVNLRYKQMALSYFSAQLNNAVLVSENEKAIIEKQLVDFESIIGTLEPSISLKRLMLNNPIYAAQIAKERGIPQELLTDEMMLEEVVNPNYQDLEAQIIETKKRIGVINIQNELTKKNLLDIEKENELITKRLLGDQNTALKDGYLNVTKSKVVVKDTVSGSLSPVAPRKSLGIAVAMVLGLVVGLFSALFITYWKREAI